MRDGRQTSTLDRLSQLEADIRVQNQQAMTHNVLFHKCQPQLILANITSGIQNTETEKNWRVGQFPHFFTAFLMFKIKMMYLNANRDELFHP